MYISDSMGYSLKFMAAGSGRCRGEGTVKGDRKNKKATACRGFRDSNNMRLIGANPTKPAASLGEQRAATSKFGLDAVHGRKNTTTRAPV
jgi:hypothetical protein